MLLKENGILGAVIPINFARGKATEKIRDYIISNHTIRYIIKPVGDMAFSEGSAFKDIILVTEKRKSGANDLTQIVFIKKSIKNIENSFIENLVNTIRNNGNTFNDDFDSFSINIEGLQKNKNNLMHILWANSYENYNIIHQYQKSQSDKKLVDFPNDFVFDCYNSAGFKGLIEATFITNPLEEPSRIERAFMILSEKSSDQITIRIKKSNLTYTVPIQNLQKGIRTLTGLRSFYINKEHDYFIAKKFPELKEIFRYSKVDSRIFYNWAEVEKRSKGKFVNLIIARRFNIYSPNTSFLAFYSDDKFISADVFKIIPNIPRINAKILCLFFNSIVNIIQMLTNREATTGDYGTIRETDLLEFKIIEIVSLTSKEKKLLIETFNKIKNINFPSILDQIENKFEGRLLLDKVILQVLGYKSNEINRLLPELYRVVTNELKNKAK
jgi:hypothetical protein